MMTTDLNELPCLSSLPTVAHLGCVSCTAAFQYFGVDRDHCSGCAQGSLGHIVTMVGGLEDIDKEVEAQANSSGGTENAKLCHAR